MKYKITIPVNKFDNDLFSTTDYIVEAETEEQAIRKAHLSKKYLDDTVYGPRKRINSIITSSYSLHRPITLDEYRLIQEILNDFSSQIVFSTLALYSPESDIKLFWDEKENEHD